MDKKKNNRLDMITIYSMIRHQRYTNCQENCEVQVSFPGYGYDNSEATMMTYIYKAEIFPPHP